MVFDLEMSGVIAEELSIHRLSAIRVLAVGNNERSNAAERRSNFPPSGGTF